MGKKLNVVQMHKIMALDIGTKRIGVALSDFLQIIASGHSCVERKSDKFAYESILKIASENNVQKIIVGIPFNMDNSEGLQAHNCKEFANLFENEFEVIYEDERLSSEQAEENLKNRKINYRKNKGLIDIESACIILEQYLSKIK